MERTIAAISTGPVPSGICMIRMSGPESFRVADRVFHKKGVSPENTGKKICVERMRTHTIHYGFISDGKNDLDEVLLSVMRAPHTFTGEDTVEISCHGGTFAAGKILELLLRNGAYAAEPGEFTKRAFLNGKIDLSKAESVIDVITAKNEFALRSSVSNLKGAVSDKIRSLREILLDEISRIEAALDDPEHYDLTGYTEELREKTVFLQGEIKEMIRRSDHGSVLAEGVRTVIAGRPNAGKSSLFNLLSGREKAIVTEIAGTTRDVLEVPVLLGQISLILMDTAGIRNTGDPVEKIGVDRAFSALREADLVLYLVDSEIGITEEDRKILNDFRKKPTILIWNKTDLSGKVPEPGIIPDGISVLPFSAKERFGLRELEDEIIHLYSAEEVSYNDQVIITNARQKAELCTAGDALDLVMKGINEGVSEEFLVIDLMNAYAGLGRILGEEVGEDIINRIFSKFCMGK